MKSCRKCQRRHRRRRQKGGVLINRLKNRLQKKALNYGKKAAIGAVDAGLKAAKRGGDFNKIASAAGIDVLKRIGKPIAKKAVGGIIDFGLSWI